MKETDKRIIELKKDGYTYREISDILNLSINYVRKRGTKKFLETVKRNEVKETADKEFEQKVIELLPYSNSLNHLCTNLCLRGVNGYYVKIKKIIDKYHLSTEHFGTLTQKTKAKGRNKYTAMSNEEFFVDGCKRTSNSILKRIISCGYKLYKCENPSCGITDWHGEPITLQIHHINGNHYDNRLENLQILCPNCHSQTINFARHKLSKSFTSTLGSVENSNNLQSIKENWVQKQKNYCINCGKEIKDNNLFCSHKCSYDYHRKFDASNEEIIDSFKMLKSFKKVGEKYGVSDNAIKKRCIKNGIIDEVYKYIKSRKRF